MIPDFDCVGNLPEGTHEANWDEIEERYGHNVHRREQLDGLKDALSQLKEVGCKVVYLDGSFVTEKEFPNDYDCLWDMRGANLDNLDIIFHPDNRNAQKFELKGEFIPSHSIEADSNTPFLDFFQTDIETQRKKGIIKINLEEFL